MNKLLAVLAFLVLLSTLARDSNAQTFTTLLSFSGSNGSNPYGGLTVSGSTLYGMTSQGGSSDDGTVFSPLSVAALTRPCSRLTPLSESSLKEI